MKRLRILLFAVAVAAALAVPAGARAANVFAAARCARGAGSLLQPYYSSPVPTTAVDERGARPTCSPGGSERRMRASPNRCERPVTFARTWSAAGPEQHPANIDSFYDLGLGRQATARRVCRRPIGSYSRRLRPLGSAVPHSQHVCRPNVRASPPGCLVSADSVRVRHGRPCGERPFRTILPKYASRGALPDLIVRRDGWTSPPPMRHDRVAAPLGAAYSNGSALGSAPQRARPSGPSSGRLHRSLPLCLVLSLASVDNAVRPVHEVPSGDSDRCQPRRAGGARGAARRTGRNPPDRGVGRRRPLRPRRFRGRALR